MNQLHVSGSAGVKELRERLGLSQREFADRFELSLSTIRKWEQGDRKPNATAKLFLELIERDPAFVSKTLAINR